MTEFEPGGVPVPPSSKNTSLLDVRGTETRMPFTAVHGAEAGQVGRLDEDCVTIHLKGAATCSEVAASCPGSPSRWSRYGP
jgi:hypothetical protein